MNKNGYTGHKKITIYVKDDNIHMITLDIKL